MEDKDRNKAKKKGNSKGIIVFLAVIFLFSIAGTEVGSMLIVTVLIFGAIGFAIIKVVLGINKSSSASFKAKFNQSGNPQRKEEAMVSERVYVPRREETRKQYYDSSDVFDNCERDNACRIEQLKIFLENGIIEKEEYQVLLRKYKEEANLYR